MAYLLNALREYSPNGPDLIVRDRCILCVLFNKLTISWYLAL
jgi:hypothetical protein